MDHIQHPLQGAKKKLFPSWKQKDSLFTLKELLNTDFPPYEWKVEGLVPLEGITILSAPPDSYKTWLLLQMAIDVARGKSFLDQFPTIQGGALIIDEESHKRLLYKRLKALGATEELPIFFYSLESIVITEQGILTGILEKCEQHNIDIIFIDSLIRVHRADENSAREMDDVFNSMKKLCKHGKTVIVTHHERKEGLRKSSASNRMRGSSSISAQADSQLAVNRDRSRPRHLVIEHAKSREEEAIPSFEVEISREGERTWFQYLGSLDLERKRSEDAKSLILNVLGEAESGLSKGEIVDAVKESSGIGEKNIYVGLKDLIQEGLVQEKQGRGNTKICFLKL